MFVFFTPRCSACLPILSRWVPCRPRSRNRVEYCLSMPPRLQPSHPPLTSLSMRPAFPVDTGEHRFRCVLLLFEQGQAAMPHL